MNIAINGFGRIGRTVFRIATDRGLHVVAINDVHGVADTVYLLQHDSIYGAYDKPIVGRRGHFLINGKQVQVLSELDPAKLPWKKLSVDVVVESTGVFRERSGASKHLSAGAKKVVITAPAPQSDILIVPGVNQEKLKKDQGIISVASCTTNCLAPTLKVLDDKFGVERAFITTVHAYTNDQSLHDEYHKKRRRGRAAAHNIVPTSSGAIEVTGETIPHLKGKIHGIAVRVPVICGSLLDVVAVLKKQTDTNTINRTFKKASEYELKGIVEYREDELVSSDIIKNPHSAVFDSSLTETSGHLAKVFAWYDNEYGYSCRVVDVLQMIQKSVR